MLVRNTPNRSDPHAAPTAMYFGNFYNPLDDLAELYKSYDQVVRIPVAKEGKKRFSKKRVYRKISKSSFRYNPLESLANLYDIPHTTTEKSDSELDYGNVTQLSFIMESPDREEESEYDTRMMPEDYSWGEPTDDTSAMWRDSGEPDETEDTSEFIPTPKRQHMRVGLKNKALSTDLAQALLPEQKRNAATRFRVKDEDLPGPAYMKRKESAHSALQSLLQRLKREGELGALARVDEAFGKHSKNDISYLPKETTNALLTDLRAFSPSSDAVAALQKQALEEIEQLTALNHLPSIPNRYY